MNRNLKKDEGKRGGFPIQTPKDYMKSWQIFSLTHKEAGHGQTSREVLMRILKVSFSGDVNSVF